MLKLWVRKYLQFYTENSCLFKPMRKLFLNYAFLILCMMSNSTCIFVSDDFLIEACVLVKVPYFYTEPMDMGLYPKAPVTYSRFSPW